MKVRIMQGPSGVGKSTFVAREYPGAVVVSADHYQVDENGNYDFRADRTDEVHRLCYRRFLDLITSPCTQANDPAFDNMVVVVDNTNTTAVEIAPYYRAAQAFGHDVAIISLTGKPEDCANRTVHKVPATTIGMMFQRIASDRLPKNWRVIRYNDAGKLLTPEPTGQ